MRLLHQANEGPVNFPFEKDIKMIKIQEKIAGIARKKKMMIFAHTYQPAEIQDIADVVADSLELARKSRESDAQTIILCGVRFMAESASILSPEKKILLPNPEAGCPMADMITPELLVMEKKKHPNAAVVTYVNSSAAVKALSDVCCTSANAVDVVRNFPSNEILFVPDQYLGSWVAEQVQEKKIHLYPGFCPIHQRFTEDDVIKLKNEHPKAVVLCHPEAPLRIRILSDQVLSTSQMIRFSASSPADEFIILTETGIAHPIKKHCPGKKFYFPDSRIRCVNMEKTTLEDLLDACEKEQFEVKVPENIRVKALNALSRMLEL